MRKSLFLILYSILSLLSCHRQQTLSSTQTPALALQPITEMTDPRDGEVYKLAKIGEQHWMAENMRYALKGSLLNPSNFTERYGRLYSWEQAQELCPDGWHLPSDEEWQRMERAVGIAKTEVYKIGSRGTVAERLCSKKHWDNFANGTNSSGFNALPAGASWAGRFVNLGNAACFWSSSEKTATEAWGRLLTFGTKGVTRGYYSKSFRRSCRCVQD